MFLSLGVRVTIPVVLLVVTVAIGVYLGLVRQSRLSLLSSKELAAGMVVKLTSASIMPAVVFGDEQEMQRAVANLAGNPDVSDVELWGFETSALGGTEGLLAQFHRTGQQKLGRPASSKSQRSQDGESIRVIEPVVNLEGKSVAALVVRFSTAREAAALAQLSRQISYVSVATAVCLAFAILLAIHRVVVRPVKRLEEAAARLARGERHELAHDHGRLGDEVALLAEQFSEMADAVRDREQRLGLRNAELKLILDSVDQGFLTARVDGTLFPERSAIVEKWTGALPADVDIWTLAGRIDPSAASWMRMAWDQATSDILPLEVAMDQLPKRLQREGQQFSLAYHPVLVDGQLQRVVIVMTDITAEVERQRALAEQHEFAALVDQFVRDRRAFRGFWNEASRLMTKILEPEQPAPELRRYIHTLKGNARFFGLSRVAATCHELESAMSEREDYRLTARERSTLQSIWESLRQRIEPLMQGATVFIEVSQDEYDRLLQAVVAKKPFSQLEELVRGLRHEAVVMRLLRGKSLLEEAARKLGKTPPQVELQHDDLRLPPGPWAPFWSVLSHVLSNAIDHGVESDDERRSAGKPVPAKIGLSARAREGAVVIEVKDDGAGIDWERVRTLAARRGLPSSSQRELEQALFTDGFSLKHEVSDTAGRGVGLAAVKNVVSALGGKIELESVAARGTTWRFHFTLGTVTDSALEDER